MAIVHPDAVTAAGSGATAAEQLLGQNTTHATYTIPVVPKLLDFEDPTAYANLVYLQAMLLVSVVVTHPFEAIVADIASRYTTDAKYGFQKALVKSHSRCKMKCASPDDYRYCAEPRASHNIDTVC